MDKKITAAVASVAVVGVLTYLGYKLVKELNDIDIWEDFHTDYTSSLPIESRET